MFIKPLLNYNLAPNRFDHKRQDKNKISTNEVQRFGFNLDSIFQIKGVSKTCTSKFGLNLILKHFEHKKRTKKHKHAQTIVIAPY